jgi:histidine triad (HIT) family protein
MSGTDDIFCRIIKGEVPAEFIYRDDEVVVFRDANPKAPVHLLVVPVQHYTGIADFAEQDGHLLGKMLRVAHDIADKQGLNAGYRLIINEGADGGKVVPHLHIHLLGGKSLGPKLVTD